MEFDDLTDELKEKVRACKSAEEVLALAKSEGRELTMDELEAVSGGGNWGNHHFITCPKCGSMTVWKMGDGRYQCQKCSYEGNPSEF